jgi:hypothetical protein
MLEDKTIEEYEQNLLCLFGTYCHLIRPKAATWHICHYCIISESTLVVAEISRRDLTHTDEIALLEQIENKPPDNSHRQLLEVIGVLKLTIVQHYTTKIS